MHGARCWQRLMWMTLGCLALSLGQGIVGCGSRIPEEEEKVACRSPKGKVIAKLERWKFDRIRQTILDTLPADGSPLDFLEVTKGVSERIPEREAKRIGKIPWFVETVALEMEVRGELQRVKHAGKTKRVRRTH
mgnify:CR=1 FL=1